MQGAYEWNRIDERASAVIPFRVVGIEGIADIFGLLFGDERRVRSIEKHIQGIQLRVRFGLVP